MRKLSDRQRRILSFIHAFTDEHGYPPSIRDIGQAVGISSTSVVDYNLRVLEREGYIRRDREVSRGIEVMGRAAHGRQSRMVRVPIIGRIAAGEPIEAVADPQDALDLPAGFVPDGCYALRVKGTSMIEDLIDDGDLVIIRPQETADNGEKVVALLLNQGSTEGVVTLKRLYREPGRIRLQPANAALQPIYVDPRDVRIQGKVVAVIRT